MSTIIDSSPFPSPSSSFLNPPMQLDPAGPTSTRPAPPSPDITRYSSIRTRTSTTPRSSRPPSAALSRANSSRSKHQQQRHSVTIAPATVLAAAQSPSLTPSPAPARAPPFLVKIRDFAYPPHDERHTGLGTDVPRPNRPRVLNHFRSDSSASGISGISGASGDDDDDDDESGWDAARGDWGAFRWGRFSWGVGRFIGAQAGYVPSTTDFARNFAEQEAEQVAEGEGNGEAVGEEGAEEEDGYDYEEYEEEAPLYPGLYRALYAFESEGAAEMALEEDQVVRVVGRGGGVGWAVVVRDRNSEGDGVGRHALVPESYLEPVRLDDEEEDSSAVG